MTTTMMRVETTDNALALPQLAFSKKVQIEIEISAVTADSRLVTPGALFVAIVLLLPGGLVQATERARAVLGGSRRAA